MSEKLRPYPAYKESGVPWLVEIPANWTLAPGLASYRPKQVKNTGLIETKVLSLSYGRIIVKPADKLHGLVPESFETYQIVDPGEIIIRPTDLQNDHTSLRVGIARDRGIITSAYMCLRTVGAMSPEYGYLLLHAYDLKKIFYGMGSGLRQNLDYRDLKRMPVLIPPPDEQIAIVRYLDYVDRRIRRYIRAKRRLIELLNEQKQAIIHQSVTRGLDPNVPLKPSGVEWLGDIPAHWEVRALKYSFESMDYGISERSTDEGSIPVLTMGDIQDGRVNVPRNGGVNSVDPRLILEDGDLLFNRTNSAELVGKVGLFKDDESCAITFASYLVRLRPNDQTDSRYFNYLLNSPVILRIARQLAIPSLHQSNLNPTRYGRIKVAVPPIMEQHRISSSLEAMTFHIDDSIASVQREVDLMREYRTRLIADVVTGKLDVREAAERLPAAEGGPFEDHFADENDVEELPDDDYDLDPVGSELELS